MKDLGYSDREIRSSFVHKPVDLGDAVDIITNTDQNLISPIKEERATILIDEPANDTDLAKMLSLDVGDQPKEGDKNIF